MKRGLEWSDVIFFRGTNQFNWIVYGKYELISMSLKGKMGTVRQVVNCR